KLVPSKMLRKPSASGADTTVSCWAARLVSCGVAPPGEHSRSPVVGAGVGWAATKPAHRASTGRDLRTDTRVKDFIETSDLERHQGLCSILTRIDGNRLIRFPPNLKPDGQNASQFCAHTTFLNSPTVLPDGNESIRGPS